MKETGLPHSAFSTGKHFFVFCAICMGLVFSLRGEGFGQGIDSLGENVDLLQVNPNNINWLTGNTRVDSVYLGAAFLRDSSKAFRVWLSYKESSMEGSLYLYIPHGANNGSDTSIFLFLNTAPLGTNVDLTNNPVVKAHIHHLDTIFFRYDCPGNNAIGYTGPNRAPGDGFPGGSDYIYSPDNNTTRVITGPTGATFTVGRRYCSAGWIRNHTTNMRTDTVRFGFEDWHAQASDFDFNDIMFNVTGIFLMYPVSEIHVRVFPNDTLVAGETATIIGELKDQTGRVLKSLGDSISWSELPPVLDGDQVLTLRNDSTTVTATVAYRRMGIVGTFTQGGVTVIDTAWLYIKAAAPDTLVIEPDSNALAASPNRARPRGTVTIGPNQPNERGYAVLRDRFQNFVGYSQNTLWSSSQTTVVTIPANGGGKTTVGEGVFTKVAGVIGTSRVDAKDNATGLTGTVTVNTEQVTYSPLRIVVGDSTDITYLEMPSDQDTLLKVLGKRSTDGVWVAVNGNWTYTATLGGMTASGLTSWRFKPTDTGSGKIVVSFSPYSTPDTLIVKIVPGSPKSMVIYNSDLQPGPTSTKLPDPSQLISVAAGTSFLLVAKVFDWKGVWLGNYQLPPLQNNISWGAGDRAGNLNSTLDGLIGAVRHFTPTKAYDTVTIVDTLHVAANNNFLDTVRFYITPGPAARLIIEPKGAINVNRPNELDTLPILANEQSKPVYTTVRDRYGNFIRYGKVWLWESFDTTVVTAKAGDSSFGEGIATRNQSAIDSITRICASDSTLKDTCFVNLVKFYYTNLRIVIGNDTNPAGLTMNTNQDTTLMVQGKRSNDGKWVNVSAGWENSANLKIDPVATSSHSWRFSPTDTGTGWIRVTMNNDGVTIPDTLPVHFTPGPPVRASIEIITPGAEIIAGKPIQAVVMVYDKDGNSYTYKFDTQNGGAAYHDLLGTGGLTFPEPFIIIDGDTVKLYGTPWDKGNETFLNGRDTVSFTLYNAPLDTTKRHQIFTNLIIGTDTIRASSTPFVLHPDKLAEVRIEYPNNSKVPDTLILTNSVTLISRGYDQYGNPYGETIGNWTVDDSLHPISGQTNGSSIIYDPSVAIKDERGHIIVNHNGITDTVYVIITGPLISLQSANTRDISGNGILDQIELHFSRGFKLPADASFAGMAVVYNKDTLPVSKILSTGSGADQSIWVVELTESHTGVPQTGWTPKIILPLQSDYSIAAGTVTAADSAGPVVWQVLTYLVNVTDHHSDSVVVTFSEPVQRFDGGSLNVGDKPGDIFYVWQMDANNNFVLVKNMFANINNLKRDPGNGNTITFIMSNGNDLNRAYYLSIADTARRYLTDASARAVPSNLNNNPRRVEIVPIPGTIITNNPIRPIFKRDPPLWFPIENRPESKDWPAIDKGGAVIRVLFPTFPLGETNAKLRYSIKIYDVVGNVVQTGDEPDFLHKNNKYDLKDLENQSIAEATVYWNGANSAGMAVAPGVYRAVVYLQYTGLSSNNSGKFQNQRYVVKLGIRR